MGWGKKLKKAASSAVSAVPSVALTKKVLPQEVQNSLGKVTGGLTKYTPMGAALDMVNPFKQSPQAAMVNGMDGMGGNGGGGFHTPMRDQMGLGGFTPSRQWGGGYGMPYATQNPYDAYGFGSQFPLMPRMSSPMMGGGSSNAGGFMGHMGDIPGNSTGASSVFNHFKGFGGGGTGMADTMGGAPGGGGFGYGGPPLRGMYSPYAMSMGVRMPQVMMGQAPMQIARGGGMPGQPPMQSPMQPGMESNPTSPIPLGGGGGGGFGIGRSLKGIFERMGSMPGGSGGMNRGSPMFRGSNPMGRQLADLFSRGNSGGGGPTMMGPAVGGPMGAMANRFRAMNMRR